MTLAFTEDAEAALIARILFDPSELSTLHGRLTPEDFGSSRYREVFRAMQALDADHRAIDIVTLSEYVPEAELRDLVREYTLTHRAPLDEYATIIKREAFRRRAVTGLEAVVARANGSADKASILSDIQEIASSLARNADEGRLLSPDQAVEAYRAVVAEREAGTRRGLTYGIWSLDEILQPAQGGEMIVLAARPSVGKTALAEMVADHWSAQGPVLFVSLEMSLTQLLDRAISRGGLGGTTRGALTPEVAMLVRERAETRRAVKVWYLDDPYARTSSVRAAAARVRLLAGGVSAIVIDYLQLLKDGNDKTEVARVTGISRDVKALAREYDVPVLALSQLNRAVMAREDQHPKLHDLRESGAIEQDADVVIGLHRELGSTELDIEVLKNRQGKVGRASVHFDPERMAVA